MTSGSAAHPGKHIVSLKNDEVLIKKVKDICGAPPEEISANEEQRLYIHRLITPASEGRKIIRSFSTSTNSSEILSLLEDTTMAQLERFPVVELQNTRGRMQNDFTENSVALAIYNIKGKSELLRVLQHEADARELKIPLEIVTKEYSLVVVPRKLYDHIITQPPIQRVLNQLLLSEPDKAPNFSPRSMPLPKVEMVYNQNWRPETARERARREQVEKQTAAQIAEQKSDDIKIIIEVLDMVLGYKNSKQKNLHEAVSWILNRDIITPKMVENLREAVESWGILNQPLSEMKDEMASALINFGTQLQYRGQEKAIFDTTPDEKLGKKQPKAKVISKAGLSEAGSLHAAPHVESTESVPEKLHTIRLSPQKSKTGQDGYMITITQDANKGTEAMVKAWAGYEITDITDKRIFGRTHFWVDTAVGAEMIENHPNEISVVDAPNKSLISADILPIQDARRGKPR